MATNLTKKETSNQDVCMSIFRDVENAKKDEETDQTEVICDTSKDRSEEMVAIESEGIDERAGTQTAGIKFQKFRKEAKRPKIRHRKNKPSSDDDDDDGYGGNGGNDDDDDNDDNDNADDDDDDEDNNDNYDDNDKKRSDHSEKVDATVVQLSRSYQTNANKFRNLMQEAKRRKKIHNKKKQSSYDDDDEDYDNFDVNDDNNDDYHDDDADDDNHDVDKQRSDHSENVDATVVQLSRSYQTNAIKFRNLMQEAKRRKKIHNKKKQSSYDDDDEDYDNFDVNDNNDDYHDDDDDDDNHDVDKQACDDSESDLSALLQRAKSIDSMTQDNSLVLSDSSEEMDIDLNQTDVTSLFRDSSEEMVLKTCHELIHNGKNLNWFGKDELGRSILHKAVERNFLSVVEKLLDYDFDPLCYDKNYHIPLQIAITKGYDEMAALIVSKLDNYVVRRLFGDNESKANKFRCKSSGYKSKLLKIAADLSEFETFYDTTVGQMFTINDLIKDGLDQTLVSVLDSFLEEQRNGSYNVHVKLLDIDDCGKEPTHEDFNFRCNTAFHNLATCNKKDAFAHPALRTYVEHKWKHWCQARFLGYFFLYLLSLFCWTYSAVTGVSAPEIHTYDTRLQHSRAFFEVIAYVFALGLLFMEIIQIVRHRRNYFTQAFNILELTSAILLVMVLPLRYINVTVHWYFYAIGYFLWGMRIFKYSIVFNATGIYAEVIKRIIIQDFVPFSILFAVVNLIFSGTFIVILKADDNLNAHSETSSLQGTMYVGLRTLIEAAAIVEYSGPDGYKTAGTILILMYLFFTIVALLNILIAQVSETYTRTRGDCVKTVLANRAWTITRAERNDWHTLPCRKPYRHYRSVLRGIDSKTIKKKESTLNDVMSEKIVKIENTQIKNGLEVQTVKTRLHNYTQRIESKVDELSEQLGEVLSLLTKQNK